MNKSPILSLGAGNSPHFYLAEGALRAVSKDQFLVARLFSMLHHNTFA